MIRATAVVLAILLTLVACGAEASPAQQTIDAVAEQTKVWEDTRDKAHRGFDEEERIDGEHCLFADDDIHPSYQLAELVKAEVENPETFKAELGKKAQEDFDKRDFWMYPLSGRDVKQFDIPLSEDQIEAIKLGQTKFSPINHPEYLGKYRNIWTDRPRHAAELDFQVETDPDNKFSPYAFYTARGFVDHWTCEVKLVDIEQN